MAAARLLLRLAGRLESVNFKQSVCGLLGAGQGPGPWYTHCRLERGQLVLSSSSFPGASERLPIQSAYPPRLSWGFPKYHHLVLFVLVNSQESQQQLQAQIQINPKEVNAFMWLEPDVAAAVAAREDGTETLRLHFQGLPPSLSATELKDDRGTQPLALPMSTLLRTTPTTAENKERVSPGTKFALRLWLQHLGR